MGWIVIWDSWQVFFLSDYMKILCNILVIIYRLFSAFDGHPWVYVRRRGECCPGSAAAVSQDRWKTQGGYKFNIAVCLTTSQRKNACCKESIWFVDACLSIKHLKDLYLEADWGSKNSLKPFHDFLLNINSFSHLEASLNERRNRLARFQLINKKSFYDLIPNVNIFFISGERFGWGSPDREGRVDSSAASTTRLKPVTHTPVLSGPEPCFVHPPADPIQKLIKPRVVLLNVYIL